MEDDIDSKSIKFATDPPKTLEEFLKLSQMASTSSIHDNDHHHLTSFSAQLREPMSNNCPKLSLLDLGLCLTDIISQFRLLTGLFTLY